MGKTALLRRFCEACGRSVRILWGGCDPLFTPRPLGPLLAVAESAGGELERLVGTGVLPHEVVAALARELRTRAATVFVLEDLHWADEATLDVFRLLVRRVETVPALDRGELPRRRARQGAPAADRARRAGDQSGGYTAQARRSLAGCGGAACRAARMSTRTSSTARRPATRSSSSRCWPPAATSCRPRSGTLSSPARRVSAVRRGSSSRRSRSSCRRPSSGCWTHLPERRSMHSMSA